MNIELGSATILKTGPGTSIQDLGRKAHGHLGVPQSGAMDQRTFLWVNHLLQNQESDAVLEISQPGFIIQFDSPTHVTLAGATTTVLLNEVEIPNPTQIHIRVHDQLKIGAFTAGARIYLGIRHGFQTQEILSSKSFYNRLTERFQFSAGDKIAYFRDSNPLPSHNSKAIWTTDWFLTDTLPVYPGPDFALLSPEIQAKLFQDSFHISSLSNRMGIQLSEPLENTLPELPTNPVYPGTVQLTSGGKLIILARDAQVTGGYPRILFLTETAQSILAQKRPGQTIRFSIRSM